MKEHSYLFVFIELWMHRCISKMIFDLGIVALILLNSVQAEFHDEMGREEGGWSYEGENGPENWGNHYPDCNKDHQSPIKLEVGNKTKAEPFIFTGYDVDRKNMVVVNNGHTVQVSFAADDTTPACIEGGGLGAKYCFAQFHFHWGLTDDNGPEHEFTTLCKKGKRVMEVHFVHTNTEAEKTIAVLGVLFKRSLFENRFGNSDNRNYKPITDALKDVMYKGQTAVLQESIKLRSLLPMKVERAPFYRYDGSLTTPPCSEGVIWTVLDKELDISKAQMEAFRNTLSTAAGVEPEEKMAPNFRPLQKLNDRIVHKVCTFGG